MKARERAKTVALTAVCAIGLSGLAACAPGEAALESCSAGGSGGAAAQAGAASSPSGEAATPGRKPLTVTSTGAPGSIGAAQPPKLPPSATVTLVTGDRVQLDTARDGTQDVTLAPGDNAPGASPGLIHLAWGGDQFAVPYAAVPYLGTTLDPRLFDVSYLVRARLDDAHSATLPVTVYGGTKAGQLPAVRVKTRGATATTAAAVDKHQARKLGQLLATSWRNGHTAGPSPSPAAAALRGTQIRLAPSAGAPALPAGLPPVPSATGQAKGLHYHTVTVNFTGPDGQPAPAVGWVQNLDDSRLGPFVLAHPVDALPVQGEQGPVKFSVPDGTYSLAFTILSPHAGTLLGVDAALVVKPQVTIGSDQTITLDARAAKPYHLTLDPPVAGSLRVDEMALQRTGADGGKCGGDGITMDLGSVEGTGVAASTLSATPTPAVTKGSFAFAAYTEIDTQDPPQAPQAAPRYYLDFLHDGAIPSDLTYTVPQAQLTTVHSHIYQSPSGNFATTCSAADTPQMWPQIYAFGYMRRFLGPQTVAVPPGEHTDYWYTNAPAKELWQTQLNAPDCTRRFDVPRHISPGEQIDQTWNKAPLAPAQVGPPTAGQGDAAQPQTEVCPACRQDDNAMVNLIGFGDSDPAHYSELFTGSDLDFYRNDKLAISSRSSILAGELMPFGLVLPLLTDPATYRLDWTTHRNGDPQATIRTDWTFRSSRGDPAATLPPTELCAPDASRACSFLPLLFLRYDLALDLKSQAKAGGPFDIGFTVAHQQNAPAPSGVAATVSVSYDGGKTWSDPLPATGQGGGKFTATITHPALADTDGFVSLRVQAHDDAGNSVDQTLIRAYALTS